MDVPMLPELAVCQRARRSRDPRFDGRFIIAVVTTGIYCRPICPVRQPAEDNVRYYSTPAAAQDAGYRPCLRCRPENASALPEWTLSSEVVLKALRLIDAGFLNGSSVATLAARFAVSARHLDRMFRAELNTTPASVARAQRLHQAKRLIEQTQLPMVEVAMHAGFGSVRRFNSEIRRVHGRAPTALRKPTQRNRRYNRDTTEVISMQLPLREPYNARWVFEFLQLRALAGVEEVSGFEYRRRLSANLDAPWLSVVWQDGSLTLHVPTDMPIALSDVLPRVQRLFDVSADSFTIDQQLATDPLLTPWVSGAPGLRVPGAWDGFETAVRAILGQQVSVAQATKLAASLIDRYGQGLFPSASVLANATPAEIGMPGRRGQAISLLAKVVTDGELILDEGVPAAQLQQQLVDIPGIGPWTAGYIALRVARDPDAFPDSDWVVLKMLQATPAKARKIAEAWRPWRGYALMYLWHAATVQRTSSVPLGLHNHKLKRNSVG